MNTVRCLFNKSLNLNDILHVSHIITPRCPASWVFFLNVFRVCCHIITIQKENLNNITMNSFLWLGMWFTMISQIALSNSTFILGIFFFYVIYFMAWTLYGFFLCVSKVSYYTYNSVDICKVLQTNLITLKQNFVFVMSWNMFVDILFCFSDEIEVHELRFHNDWTTTKILKLQNTLPVANIVRLFKMRQCNPGVLRVLLLSLPQL